AITAQSRLLPNGGGSVSPHCPPEKIGTLPVLGCLFVRSDGAFVFAPGVARMQRGKEVSGNPTNRVHAKQQNNKKGAVDG
ncbi:hypothetical protein ACC811_37265, partial [Rhizobium ruizarguesonis]